MQIRFFLPLALAVALPFAACNKNKNNKMAGVDGNYDYVSGTPLADRNEGANFFGNNVDRSKFQPVFFAYDSFQIDSSETSKIQEAAKFMKTGSHNLIVAGFTDARGTAEYNRSLGERRAQAVRSELISMGANGGNIQTVSFGSELPADAGDGESSWSRNRRAEFGVVK